LWAPFGAHFFGWSVPMNWSVARQLAVHDFYNDVVPAKMAYNAALCARAAYCRAMRTMTGIERHHPPTRR
jgi:hypothetical protein